LFVSLENLSIKELSFILVQMERLIMSDPMEVELQNLTNQELIDLALECVGGDRESIRQAALVEHYNRIKDSPEALRAPAGDTEMLEQKMREVFDRLKES
jgi:hypothetical protein